MTAEKVNSSNLQPSKRKMMIDILSFRKRSIKSLWDTINA